jgi:uracil-DNA glycosylase
MSAEEVLAQVAKEVSVCQKCALYHSRKKSVPGEGTGRCGNHVHW